VKLSKLKLKHQMILLVAVSAFLLILIQLFYFYSFYNLTQERAGNYEQKIINQTFVKIESVLKDIKTNTDMIVLDKNLQEFVITTDYYKRDVTLGPFVLDLMEYVKTFNSIIYCIQIEDNYDRKVNNLVTDGNLFNTKEYASFMEKYNRGSKDFKKPLFTSVMKDPITGKTVFFYLAPIIEILGGEHFAEKMGVCTITINTSNIQELIENTELTPNSILAVLDDENRIVVSNSISKQGMLFGDLPQGISGVVGSVNMTYYKGKRVIFQQRNLEQAKGWKIISIIPVNELTADMNSTLRTGIISVASMILILFVLGVLFFRNITQPVAGLVKDMKKIGENKIGFRIKVRSANEVGILAMEINSMVGRIEEMTRNIFNGQTRMYEMELAKRQAEFLALQSQINPHFLYNTLNCMSSIGLDYGSTEIAQICSGMSMIFRYSIKSADIVQIGEELECIKAYLDIINIRYDGKYSLEIDVEEGLMQRKTPKMILQPIVENAIYHGLENCDNGGRLIIKGYMDGDSNVCFSVFDSGQGIEEAKLERIRSGLGRNRTETLQNTGSAGSIGLVNIDSRIKLLFGDQYGIRIESKAGWGTKVTIRIPGNLSGSESTLTA
jgi:two-component system sensor histidine kinase YesM